MIIQISELLLKKIDEKILLVIQKEKQFSFDLFIRGHLVYMRCKHQKLDMTLCICEDGNEHDKYAVPIMK